ncbi:MAG: UMP kinase [Rickettsiaceae bacterium]
MPKIKYKRVLLKVSGEALMGRKEFGYDYDTIKTIAQDIKDAQSTDLQVCVVVGGGNIYRGKDFGLLKIDRAAADHIGMVATVINALALQNVMESIGVNTRVLSAIPMTTICEPYISRKAKRHMEKGRVVIFAAGTGHPFCTTDSAAVLRAIEMDCDLLLKGTQVDGVYDSDPTQNPNARKYDILNYDYILEKNLQIMDLSAITLAKENKLPILVFSIRQKGNFLAVLQNKGIFSFIEGE